METLVRFASIAALRFCSATSYASRWASLRVSAVFSSDSSSGVRVATCGRFISGKLVSRRNARDALFAPCLPESTRRGSCTSWAVCLRGGEACVLETDGRGEAACFGCCFLALREAGGVGSARTIFVCVVAAESSLLRTGTSRSGGGEQHNVIPPQPGFAVGYQRKLCDRIVYNVCGADMQERLVGCPAPD